MSKRDLAINALCLLAIGAISVGVGLVFFPAGLIVLGLLLFATAYLVAVGVRR